MRYPNVNIWRRWGFYVQCFSMSPMHGMAFLGCSSKRVGNCIVTALHLAFSQCMQDTVAFSLPRSNRAEWD